MSEHSKILVLGAGFGGLSFVRHFTQKKAEIRLVDQRNHHLFQPLLYQVATGGLVMQSIAEPVRCIFSKRKNVQVLMDTVESIDLQSKSVKTANRTLDYDYLIIAVGMVSSYFGNNHWAKHSIGLKSLQDARNIRARVLSAFEKAESITDETQRRQLMTIAIVGGGPSGVEMAGALCELTRRVFKSEFRSIKPEESQILLIEGSDRLLGAFSHKSSERALSDLRKIGVDVRLNTKVESIEENTIVFNGQRIQSSCIIWTAGVEGAPLLKQLNAPLDRRGRLLVEADCSLKEHPEVFAIGDIASFENSSGAEVPGVSPAAIQMGQHVSRIIRKEIDSGKTTSGSRPAFKYRDKGSMATIGRSAAVAELGRLTFSGSFAWLLWLGVHLFFLINFRNRVGVLMQWFWAYVRYRPSGRVIE